LGKNANHLQDKTVADRLSLEYNVQSIKLGENEQKEPWFLEINPNGRIPALTDASFDDGKGIHLFESGSIMQYLVAEYDSAFKLSFPPGTREAYELNNWLFFQNAGVGPMQGQANHFTRYTAEKIQYGIDRYINETRRLYGVLEKHLATREWLVGGKFTIADIAHYGWISAAPWAGVDLDAFPNLKAWQERAAARPAVAKGEDIPYPSPIKKALASGKADEEAAETRKWVQAGMKGDSKK
jgi:glutathione S-transferase